MGSYATTAQLEERFEDTRTVAILTGSTDMATPDAAVLTEVVDSSEGVVNAYLAKVYETPVSTANTQVANTLKMLTLAIAEYQLILRTQNVPEQKVKARDDAVEMLKLLADGEIKLPSVSPLDSTGSVTYIASGDDDASTTTSNRVFTRASQVRL